MILLYLNIVGTSKRAWNKPRRAAHTSATKPRASGELRRDQAAQRDRMRAHEPAERAVGETRQLPHQRELWERVARKRAVDFARADRQSQERSLEYAQLVQVARLRGRCLCATSQSEDESHCLYYYLFTGIWESRLY